MNEGMTTIFSGAMPKAMIFSFIWGPTAIKCIFALAAIRNRNLRNMLLFFTLDLLLIKCYLHAKAFNRI
jgi:hypothetical protein